MLLIQVNQNIIQSQKTLAFILRMYNQICLQFQNQSWMKTHSQEQFYFD